MVSRRLCSIDELKKGIEKRTGYDEWRRTASGKV
jgi:hypothetical protein